MTRRRTYAIPEVAADMCGTTVKDPVRWVMRHIYSGQFKGYKVGRQWRMTEDQVDAAYKVLENAPLPEKPQGDEVPVLQLTAAAARRRSA